MWRPLIVLFLTISVALYLLSFPYAEALHGQGSSFYRRRRHKFRSYTRFEVTHITVTLDGIAKPYKLVQQKVVCKVEKFHFDRFSSYFS